MGIIKVANFSVFQNHKTTTMKHFIVVIGFFISVFSGFSQSKIQKHTVQKGETITQIAQKYKVTPSDIYRLNPDSQQGLKPEMVLLIQSATVAPKKEKTEVLPEAKSAKTHTVAAKETIYGLTKMYSVSEEQLLKANPDLKNGLKVGSTITIPGNGNAATSDKKPTKPVVKKIETVYHTVEAKETKYSIAKQYGLTVDELDASNPEVKDGLQIGFRLKITPNPSRIYEQTVSGNEEKTIVTKIEPKKPELSDYVVKPKETLYSLTKKFNLSQEELIKLNPELKDGVKEGMTLQYPSSVIPLESVDKNITNLAKTFKSDDKKTLVLLLPFNISKITGDTLNSTAARLKTDKFLNMTLDFYSGALMAIDSAKTLGLNIDVKILDSQETKNSSAVATLIQQNDIQKANAVIGPFYQANVEKTAELLNKNKVPVISPLSKETGKLFGNVLQSMPEAELVKNNMLEYLRSKNANIIAIIDPKKLSTRQFLTQNHKDIKLIGLTPQNLVSADSLTKKLVKGKMNYVIFDSEKTGLILNTLNVLIAQMADYQIQLVILEKNDTFDFEEIPLAKLAQLKLLYPSLTRDNETPDGLIFAKVYKEKNKIFPNHFATRGFDVTFDTMLRLSQEKSFVETIETTATEGVENKFEYEKKPSGAFVNKGFYILYYDTDLSVKEAE